MSEGKSKYLELPFEKFDTESLEALPDDVFFARRFKVSEEDQKIIDRHTTVIDGREFYKVKVTNPIFEKYAAMTNPGKGEPGSVEKPLVRFGKEYVYDRRGRLLVFRRIKRQMEEFVLTPDMKPSEAQVQMIHGLEGKPITEDADCPSSSPERIQRFLDYGKKKNEKRRLAMTN